MKALSDWLLKLRKFFSIYLRAAYVEFLPEYFVIEINEL